MIESHLPEWSAGLIGADADRELDAAVTIAEAFDALDNKRRRYVIDVLVEQPDTTVSSVTDGVATREYGVTREQLDPQQRKRVYISLYQTHLSRLDDVGFVAYDGDRATVTQGPAFGVAVAILEVVREHCVPATGDEL